jgi:hypothetical protein
MSAGCHFQTHAAQYDLLGDVTKTTGPQPLYERVTLKNSPSKVAAVDQRLAQSSIAATASISISHPGRIRRLTTTNVLAGGLATLR